MNHVAKATPLTKPRSAVDYFYSAAKRRSRGVLWPIFTPALIHVFAALTTQQFNLLFVEFYGLNTDVNSGMTPCLSSGFQKLKCLKGCGLGCFHCDGKHLIIQMDCRDRR
jgi:hypothetical protein